MNRLDYKHIAFHALVGLYFIWAVVFAVLIALSVINIFTDANAKLNDLFFSLILLNILMGTVLFIVIRLFRNKAMLGRIIAWSFYLLAGAAVAAVMLIKSKV